MNEYLKKQHLPKNYRETETDYEWAYKNKGCL